MLIAYVDGPIEGLSPVAPHPGPDCRAQSLHVPGGVPSIEPGPPAGRAIYASLAREAADEGAGRMRGVFADDALGPHARNRTHYEGRGRSRIAAG